jgi:hypothetical protein
MDAKRAFRWSGYYFALTTIATVVGLALVGAGALVGGKAGFDAYQAGAAATAALRTAAPGLALALVGVVVWRLGKAVAFYKTLTGAMEDELANTYDTEHVKADILSVLDDRLADIQHDIQSMNRNVRKLDDETAEAGDFEFEG